MAGMLFSLLAFLYSMSARKAALRASKIAQLRSIAEEMTSNDRAALEIAEFLESERFDLARDRVRTLRASILRICARRERQLKDESKKNLMTAREQLESMENVLVRSLKKTNKTVSAQDSASLSLTCQRVIGLLCTESGFAMTASEHAGEKWIE